MTRMKIDAAIIGELGVSLGEIATNLETAGDGDKDGAAFGDYDEAQAAFDHLMEGWRRQRFALVEHLEALSDKASTAGSAYLETEQGIVDSCEGGAA